LAQKPNIIHSPLSQTLILAYYLCSSEAWFCAEVETPPGGQIDFILAYEQLLRRRLGAYELSFPLGGMLFLLIY